MPGRPWTDEQVEQLLGRVLQVGVVLAAAVVLLGGVGYLLGHAMQEYDYRVFRGEPVDLRTLEGIMRGALGLDGRDVVQLGVVLLLATPIARVALSAFAFARQRDVTYVLVTSVVLLLLLASLLAG
ncbi:MAG: DUF1634 domain-containing protein [Candidatus Rokuibacteriota bacterium]|nr:MAG: hypothetical protein AUI36_09800 [Cyanobacteria bacterium 13_1_40CM_2_61_4]PYN83067.1 MAG: DUF1634 domain-containing protein [Candidatus Rokubacteria bacterium]